MGKGGDAGPTVDRETPYTWEEIRKHTTQDDTWIVLEGGVYDVSNFKKRHPGGWLLMEDHAGQDATVSEGSCDVIGPFVLLVNRNVVFSVLLSLTGQSTLFTR